MRYQEPKPSEWQKLDLSDDYAAGMAYQRFTWLMAWDPYGAILTEHVQQRLANLIFSDHVLGSGPILVQTEYEVGETTLEALEDSPLCALLTDVFLERIVGFVQTAVFAGKEK